MKHLPAQWLFYNVAVCFAVYWLSNLLLWYPWSVNEGLGQVLMLTVNPVLWGVAAYACIIRYPGQRIMKGVALNSLLFLTEAVFSDLLFFVGIRHAADKLMHITTLYAWAFVGCVPFLVYLLFKRTILQNRKALVRRDFRLPLLLGFVSLAAIVLVLLLDIRFG